MGAIRLLLAVAVAVSHGAVSNLYGFRFLSSALAVQAFFILSGFYMALVLDTTYRGRRMYLPFMANRALRLFPIYWLVCALTLAFLVIAADRPIVQGAPDALRLIQPLDAPTTGAAASAILTNITMVGQDAVHFFVATPEGLRGLGAEEVAGATPLYRFLLVPQAWTLSFELLFYACAPFLVRRSTASLAFLTVASLALLGWLHATTDLMRPPAWEFKFLPAQAWTFTLGILLYRGYRHPRMMRLSSRLAVPSFVLLGLGLLFGAYGGALMHRLHPALDQWLVLVGIVVLLPLAFRAFERGRPAAGWLGRLRRADGFLGDLSYAVYISHVMAYLALYVALDDTAVQHERHLTAAAVVLSIAVSWGLVGLVHRPVETLRDRLRARATVSDAAGTVTR